MAIVKNADFKYYNGYLNILVNHFIVTMHYYKYNKKPTADLA